MAGKLNRVLEGYRPIPMKRLFYPRGMKLSENFINAFHQEYDRLVGEGINPRSLLERFSKALKFHVTEKRRYNLPVVEDSTPTNGKSHATKGRNKKKKLKEASLGSEDEGSLTLGSEDERPFKKKDKDEDEDKNKKRRERDEGHRTRMRGPYG